jgi:site-specific recombinase XerD
MKSWCEEESLREGNPVPPKGRGKKSRRAEDGMPEFFHREQVEELVREAEADAKAKGLGHGNRWFSYAVRFAVGTGMRRGEIVHLRWRAVNLEENMLRVECTDEFATKNGRERFVPLVGEARRVVQQRYEQAKKRAGGVEPTGYVFRGAREPKLGPGYLSERFRLYRRKAKLPENLHFHSLRHTFASWFVMRGGDLYRLKEILGHAGMETTLKYAHLQSEALQEEMQQTFGAGNAHFASQDEVASSADSSSPSGDGAGSQTDELRAEVKRLREELAEAQS